MINDYFISRVQKIIPKSLGSVPNLSKLTQFVNNNVESDSYFTIPLVTTEFIYSELEKLGINKISKLDGLSPKILKISAQYICTPLKKIINFCISNGVFPQRWKQAKIIPMYKAGPVDDISSYRPISILPALSKIIVRHIFRHFNQYLIKYI